MFKGTKGVVMNSTHYFIMEIPNKRELQQTAINHSWDVDSMLDFIKVYKNVPLIYVLNYMILLSDNPYRKSILELIYNKSTIIDDQIKDEKL